MNKCCKKCDYEFSIWGEPVARGCNDSNCKCHKKMTNQPWQERFRNIYKTWQSEPGKTNFQDIELLNERYGNLISELLQEAGADGFYAGAKRRSEYGKKKFAAGYKLGREECLKDMREFIKNPKNGLEELQNLINEDEK